MSVQPFAPPGQLTAAALAGQTVPGTLTVAGNVTASSGAFVDATGGLRVLETLNSKQGTVTLAAGTATVTNSSITANSRIFLACQSLGTVSSPSALCVSARTAGTSFTILASQGTDTSVIAYEIFEPG